MSTSTIESKESKNEELKHLGFVRIAAINALIWITNLYEYAKQNSGPLRSGVRTVEGTVTSVMRPVCEKFKDAPLDLLVFLDNKVDEVSNKFDEHAPPMAKQVVNQTWVMVQKASQLAYTLVSEARTGGAPAAVNCAATKYKQFVLDQAVKAWFTLNKVPTFQMVAEKAVPMAAQWSDKYNQVVTDMTQKGYTVFSYLPHVPVDKIAQTFKQGGAKTKGTESNSDLSSDDDK